MNITDYQWESKLVLIRHKLPWRRFYKDYLTCYISDIRIWTNRSSFDEHVELIEKVWQRIAARNLKTDLLKYNWGVTHT